MNNKNAVPFELTRFLTIAAGLILGGSPGDLPGQSLHGRSLLGRSLLGQSSRGLTAVRDVRSLTSDQAREARPVRLHGIVTALSGWKNSFFVQDSTGAISVDRTDKADVQVGDQVEIAGTSSAGMFAPVVMASYVRVTGHAPPPVARRVTYEDMYGGREDSQWIEVSGVVHSAHMSRLFGHDTLLLTLELSGGSMKLALQDFAGMDYERLVDSAVRVRGVCFTDFNQKRQLVGLGMFVPDRRDVDIVQPSENDPFSLPPTPFRNVLQFGQTAHRVKVIGVSTYQIPGHALYLQSGNDGIRILSSSNEPVEPGRKVEAVGFPVLGDYAPVLKDGIFRVIGYADPVKPLRIQARDVIAQEMGFNRVPYDEQLVELQGKVAESHLVGGQRVLILRQENEVFEAYLPQTVAAGAVMDTGSIVLLTGICTVNADSDRNALSFAILVRSVKDVVILKQAPWWTASHAGWIVALLAILLFSVSGWLAVVRRQDSLRALTLTDPLTGLYNRRGFFMLAERQWQLALRSNTAILLLYIDVDRFKEINDSLGHKEGDLAIQAVAGVLRESFRKTDIVARVGGDEFAVAAVGDSGDAQTIIEQRLATAVQQTNAKRARTAQLSLSIGILNCDGSMETLCIEDLLAKADALMYDQKRNRQSRQADGFVLPAPVSS